jgi:hypothetical protein
MLTPERWKESVETAEEMMKEAGVIIRYIDEPIGGRMRFNGENIDI